MVKLDEWSDFTQSKCVVVLFGRKPVPGKVKTRLAKSIGPEAAADLYRDMAEIAVTNAMSATGQVIFSCSEADEVHDVKRWLKGLPAFHWQDIAVRAQPQSVRLEDRLTDAILSVFEDEGADSVIVAGTDVPRLSSGVIVNGVLLLRSYDIVLGPAEDGGYYLIGIQKQCVAGLGRDAAADFVCKLFKGIHWSTQFVFREQVRNAKSLGLTVAPYNKLPCLVDIDTFNDVRVFVQAEAERAQRRKKRTTAMAGVGERLGSPSRGPGSAALGVGAGEPPSAGTAEGAAERLVEKMQSLVTREDGEGKGCEVVGAAKWGKWLKRFVP